MGKYTLSIEIVKGGFPERPDRLGGSRAGRANVPGTPSGGSQEDRAMAKSVYDEIYARSMRDPDGFWAAAAEDIHWDRRWDRVFDDSRRPFYRWFLGGELNTCYNAVDLHVDRGRGKQRALVYDSPVTGTVRTYTYFELRDAVALCAGMLRRQGIEKGDRVIIYMPMVPEAVIAMLACARIGAIHSVVFGGFASNELAKRIDDSQPKLILSSSCGIEVNRVVPYKPLLKGCPSILYGGKPVGTPDPGAFWRLIAEHGVNALFTAPTAFRAIKKEDPQGTYMSKYDLSRFRTLFLAGERCDPDTLHWAEDRLKVPVIDHWWQTETGWPIAANCVGLGMLPVKAGSPTKAVPGYEVRVLDEDNRELAAGQIGSIALKLPLAPGCLPTPWNNDARYEKSYLPKHPWHYLTGDAGYRDEDGYLYIMSRVDDIINVAGHRLSTGAMEEVLSSHQDVAECAVVGVADEIKGEVPVGFVVTKAGVARGEAEIVRELVEKVREQIGPVAAFKTALVVKRLPKTRSGKILRGTMKRIADGQEYNAPATIDDPAILGEIAEALGAKGYPQRG